MPRMIAYTDTHGRITIGTSLPRQMLELANGPAGQLRRAMRSLALRGHGGTLLVPGVAEAATTQVALQAAVAFKDRLRAHFRAKDRRRLQPSDPA